MNNNESITCYYCFKEIEDQGIDANNDGLQATYCCKQCALEKYSENINSKIGCYNVWKNYDCLGDHVSYYARKDSESKMYVLKLADSCIPENKNYLFEKIENHILALKSISHPNILQLCDWGVSNRRYWFVSPFMRKGNLTERIDNVMHRDNEQLERDNLFGMIELCKGVVDILDVLSYLHKKGYIHGNIKPQNILFGKDTNKKTIVTLADFQFSNSYLLHKHHTRFEWCRPKDIVFFPPEQAINFKDTGLSTDLYALGMCMYNIISKSYPYGFYGTQREPLKIILGNDKPFPIEGKTDDIPVHLARIINKAINKDVSKRFHSVEEFKEEITLCLEYYFYIIDKTSLLKDEYRELCKRYYPYV
jgi:serine/threonine protein kinase